MECEVIGGYNDTENAIIQYESDKENNYNNWGLFATRNSVSNHSYYYERNGIISIRVLNLIAWELFLSRKMIN